MKELDNRTCDRAVYWYEWWAEKYNDALNYTFLQQATGGQKSLVEFYGYFGVYEDEPNVTAKLESAKLYVVYVGDFKGGECITDALLAQLNKKAVARLRKIEKKLIEWRKKIDDAE